MWLNVNKTQIIMIVMIFADFIIKNHKDLRRPSGQAGYPRSIFIPDSHQ